MKAWTSRKLESVAGYLFIAPAMAGFVIFVFIPTIAVIILSLFQWDLIGIPAFIGIANFIRLFSSSSFINTLKVTAIYVLIHLPPEYLLAMIFGLALRHIKAGHNLLRILILLPWITTPIATSIVWKWVLNPKMGLVAYYMRRLGLPAIDFFNADISLVTIALVNMWQFVGFSSLLLFIGMQNIPMDYYEAADIDGVNAFSRFFCITLPLLRPTLMYMTITGVINSFQVFDTVFGMTRGGPGEATNVYYFAIYMEGFQFLNMGYAAAMCTVLFVILLMVTGIQLRMYRDSD
jgi:multiple sugar transport system permease protein/sn-glycerol 3-phosphate transport system permease protein